MISATQIHTLDRQSAQRRQIQMVYLVLGLGTLALALRQVLHHSHAVMNACTNALTDFCVFWGAARLAWRGDWGLVFDPQALSQASGNLDGSWFPWLHPPGALLLAAPLGALPPGLGWIVFLLLSLVAWHAVLRHVPQTGAIPPMALLFAPALIPALILGQMTVLWMAGAILALLALGRGQMTLAGVYIGLLTLKPTLGLLLPVALIAMGAWRSIGIATGTTVLLHGLATVLFGWDYWSDMAAAYGEHGTRVAEVLPLLDRMASLPAGLTRLGWDLSPALTAQTAMTLVLALLVYVLWRNPRISFDRKAALFLAVAPLATPYLWYYDAGLVLGAALFLHRDGRLGPWGLVPFWLGPGLIIWTSLLWPGPLAASLLLAPIMICAVAIAMLPQRHGPHPHRATARS